jgi:hypothetical protein
MVGSAVNKPIELVMTSSTLVIQLTGQNQSCKGHRPLLTSVTWSGLGYTEYWKIVDRSWFRFFKKGAKNWTRLDLKALATRLSSFKLFELTFIYRKPLVGSRQ